MLKTLYVITLALFLSHSIYAQDFSDSPTEIEGIPVLYGDLHWIDLDNDKDLDAVSFNWVEKLKIFKNTNQVFEEVADSWDDESAWSTENFMFVDFDKNGYLDILLMGNNKISVIKNYGDFTFTLEDIGIDFVSGTSGPNLNCFDVDADADLDVIVGHTIYANNSGVFTKAIASLPENLTDFLWGDLDNDSIPDLVGLNYSEWHFMINRGGGVFYKIDEISSVRQDARFFLFDADGDRDLDAYVSDASYQQHIYKNTFTETGEVSFVKAYTIPYSGNINVDYGDIDRDGKVDLLVQGYGGSGYKTVMLKNTSVNGSLSFTQHDLGISIFSSTAFTLTDFDHDGDLDFQSSDYDMTSVYGKHKVYFNEQVAPVTAAPVAPQNLITEFDDYVNLGWEHIPNSFYAIEIDKNSQRVVPSYSHSDGTLLAPKIAQTVFTAGYVLQNLDAGDYRWRVQAIDHASRASAFSDYQHFTIGLPPSNLTLQAPNFTEIILSWEWDGAEPVHFGIFRRSASESWTKIATVAGNETMFLDNMGLLQNETYEYTVKAYSGTQYSAGSNIVAHYSGQFNGSPFGQLDPNIAGSTGKVADFDSDGDYDFQYMGSVGYPYTEVMMQNDGQGNFTAAHLLPAIDYADDAYSQMLYSGDMDSDGDIDICAIIKPNWSGIRVAVFTNTDGSYTKTFESADYNYISDHEIADFNNDGLMDILHTFPIGGGNNPNGYLIHYQKRSGAFVSSELKVNKNDIHAGAFKTVDINMDGFLDIFFSGTSDTKPVLAVNRNGDFFEIRQTSIFAHEDIHFQDLNADGKIDCIYPHYDSRLVYHLGLGDDAFGEPVFIKAFYLNSMRVENADLDFNGWPELIITDGYNVGVMQNNGAGQLTVAPYTFSERWGSHALLTDIENDGDVDIVISGVDQHQGLSTLYQNMWKSSTRTNAAPAPPSNVTISSGEGFVKITWQPASDDTTPEKLISYNVLVKDDQGKSWLHPATTDAGTFRKVLGTGNAGFLTFFTLKDLPAGNYTAKVQAVDASFGLSTWSEASTFTIEPGPGNLSVERILLNKVKLSWSTTPGAERILVQRKTQSSTYQVIAELAGASTSFTDADLKLNEVFTYRVLNETGETSSAPSNEVTWNTAPWEIQNSMLPNAYAGVQVGDFTGDGIMDVVMNGTVADGSYSLPTKAVFEKNGADYTRINFGDATQNIQAGAFAMTDLNGDNKFDLYEHFYNDGYKTNVFLNNGDKTFSAGAHALSSGNHQLLSLIDFDMDNDLDLHVVFKPTSGDPTEKILKNKGAGQYEEASIPPINCKGYYCGLQVEGDFDQDGDEDLIRHNGSSVSLFLNSPDGYQTSAIVLPINGVGVLYRLDFNSDGKPDLLFISNETYGTSKLFQNLGVSATEGLKFQLVTDNIPKEWGGFNVNNAADFDHDGDLDFVVITSGVSVFSNTGNGTFERFDFPRFRITSTTSQMIDYDGDGDLDILFTGYMWQNYSYDNATVAKVLINRTIENGKGNINAAPATPTNLRARQDGSGIHLEWDKPSDDHTPSDGISYDVVIHQNGTAVHTGTIMPASGHRTKLVAGRSTHKLLLTGIPSGSFDWQVQAVDQNYLGSQLSAKSTFIAIPPPPLARDTTIFLCGRTATVSARGQNIQWYSDQNLQTLIASGELHPNASQTVYVTQTINGVRGLARVVRITVLNKPEAPTLSMANPSYYCENFTGSVYLHASGENVNWFSSADLTFKVSGTPYYTAPAQPKTYYVVQTLQGCVSNPLEVSVQPLTFNTTFTVQDQRITVNETRAQYYWWYRNNVVIKAGAENFVIWDGETAQYRVRMFGNGCEKMSDTFVVTDVEENEESTLSLFPNPARKMFTLLGNDVAVDVRIFNSNGKLFFTTKLGAREEKGIQSGQWPAGVYLVVFFDGLKTRTIKLVIDP